MKRIGSADVVGLGLLAVALGAVAFFAAELITFQVRHAEVERQADHALQERLATAIQDAPAGTEIDLSGLARGAGADDWDRLHIIGPYAHDDEIEAELGFAWPEARYTGIEGRDDVTLLVFVRGREVVRYVIMPRHAGDFSRADQSGGYSSEETAFTIVHEPQPNGSNWVYLVPSDRGGLRDAGHLAIAA